MGLATQAARSVADWPSCWRTSSERLSLWSFGGSEEACQSAFKLSSVLPVGRVPNNCLPQAHKEWLTFWSTHSVPACPCVVQACPVPSPSSQEVHLSVLKQKGYSGPCPHPQMVLEGQCLDSCHIKMRSWLYSVLRRLGQDFILVLSSQSLTRDQFKRRKS